MNIKEAFNMQLKLAVAIVIVGLIAFATTKAITKASAPKPGDIVKLDEVHQLKLEVAQRDWLAAVNEANRAYQAFNAVCEEVKKDTKQPKEVVCEPNSRPVKVWIPNAPPPAPPTPPQPEKK